MSDEEECTLSRNLSLSFKIALVSDDNDGKVVLVFDSENLLVEGGDFLEGVATCDGVDAQEALACPHILLTHGSNKGEYK